MLTVLFSNLKIDNHILLLFFQMTIEEAFDEFEHALDDKFTAMNMNDLPSGGVFLPSPCPLSDDESKSTPASVDNDNETRMYE